MINLWFTTKNVSSSLDLSFNLTLKIYKKYIGLILTIWWYLFYDYNFVINMLCFSVLTI